MGINREEMNQINILQDRGQGRPYIAFFENRDHYQEYLRNFKEFELKSSRTIIFECNPLSDLNWNNSYLELTKTLDNLKIKQAAFITFGATCTLIQNLALQDLKSVRTIVFIDATCRPHPSKLMRIADKIEDSLPLGLPLRMQNQSFDAKPFLHRIRCPVLVVITDKASGYQREQAAVLAAGLPSAWSVEVKDSFDLGEFARMIEDFQEVPVKCSQKNIR